MKNANLARILVLSLALATAALTGVPATADAPLVEITGTVVSRDGDVLVVATPQGNLTFDIDKSTEMPPSLPVGSRITIWYDSDDKPEDKMDARRIVMAPATDVSTQTQPQTQVQTQTQTQTDVTTETRSNYTSDYSSSSLPATASPLPLVGGTGLLALLGGGLLLLRSRRK